MSTHDLDLGQGFSLRYVSWDPDRKLNPQYRHLFSVAKFGAIVTCRHGVEGVVNFDHGPQYAALFPNADVWTVESWEPLTLKPSIQTGCCHGHIREGKWEDA